jgi:putative transposase
VHAARPSATDAIVVVPGDLHCICTLPEHGTDSSTRWTRPSRVASKLAPTVTGGHVAHRSAIWQRRFWERVIRDARDLERYADHIHYTPVKHRWATRLAAHHGQAEIQPLSFMLRARFALPPFRRKP